MSHKNLLMTSDEKGTFHFEIVDRVPEGAHLDNWAQVGPDRYKVFCMPDTAVVGRTFTLQLWAEATYEEEYGEDSEYASGDDHEDEFEGYEED